MTVTIEWELTGTVRKFDRMSQKEVNRFLTFVSELNDKDPVTRIKMTVSE